MEKAEVEEKSVENSKGHIKGETLPRRYQSSGGQMQESFSVMNEETLELREFILQEEIRIKELCSPSAGSKAAKQKGYSEENRMNKERT